MRRALPGSPRSEPTTDVSIGLQPIQLSRDRQDAPESTPRIPTPSGREIHSELDVVIPSRWVTSALPFLPINMIRNESRAGPKPLYHFFVVTRYAVVEFTSFRNVS